MASTDVINYTDSDEEAPFQSRKTKRLLLSDSDEEKDTVNPDSSQPSQNENIPSEKESSENESSPMLQTNKRKKRIVRIERESEDDSEITSNRVESSIILVKKTSKLDSDSVSSDEEIVKSKREVASQKKFKDILYNKLHKKKSKDNTGQQKPKSQHVSSEESDLSDNSDNGNDSKVHENQFANKDLYDAESSEEDRHNLSAPSDKDSASRPVEVNGKGKEKMSKKKPLPKPAQRKSSAEALEKIHAETQRLIRESNVSLPYFLPKPTSISEFLQKRKPIPAIPLRAKGDSLNSYIHLYEERMKSITETFQHMSSSEDEESDKTDEIGDNKENVTNNSLQNNETDMEVDSTNNVTKMEMDYTEENIAKDKSHSNNELADSKEIDNIISSDATLKIGESNSDENINIPDTLSINNNLCKEVTEKVYCDSQTDELKETTSNVNNVESKDKLIDKSVRNVDSSDNDFPKEKFETECHVLSREESTTETGKEQSKKSAVLETSNDTNECSNTKLTNQESPSPEARKQSGLKDSTRGQTESSHIQQTLDETQNKMSQNKLNPTDCQPKSNDIDQMSGESQPKSNDIDQMSGGSQSRSNKIEQMSGESQSRSNKIEQISGGSQSRSNKIEQMSGGSQSRSNKIEQMSGESQSRSNEIEQMSGESQSKSNEIEQMSGESQPKFVDSQQNSECNIFSNLTDTEFLEETEYTAELCDDLDSVTQQDTAKQNRPPVKKRLFSEWTNSVNASSNLDGPSSKPEVGTETITLKPLSRNYDDFIELDDTVKCASNLKPGVWKLMQRYSRHVSTKVTKPTPANQTVSLNITTTERDSQGEITGYSSEALSIVLQDDSDLAMSKHSAASKPGAKLVKLKEELDREMTKKREEAWKRRIEEAKMDEEMYDGEKSDCEADNEEFDEDENDLEDVTTEEDEELDDVREKPKKKRAKSDFLDEEAEVSDDADDVDDADDDDESEEEDDAEEGEEEEDKDVLSGDEKPKEVEDSPKSLKRKTKTFDMFASQRNEDGLEFDEEELPGYQMGVRTSACTPAPGKVVFSPVVSLTGCDKSLGKNQDASFSMDTTQQPPSHPFSPHPHQQAKKLNFDSLDPDLEQPSGLGHLLPTQPGNELEDLFSGQFSSQTLQARDLEANDDPCQFVTQTQAIPDGLDNLLGNTCTESLSNLCSGAFTSQPVDGKQLEANDGTCDQFVTSLNTAGNEDAATEDETRKDEVHRLLLNKSSILSSDEEEDLDTSVARKKITKAPKRLVYSDDEEEEKEEDNALEAEADESEIENNEDDAEVEYDSEENEVVKRVDEFFEAEAELSESEWGSEDEDENEMDKMEQEEADKEYHDQEQLKEELGKIHMKQVLDDDNREVKMLQEILLEDGELHSEGPGRQRQFKWSNLDDNSDLRITAALSGESEGEEEGELGEENKEDEVWRKARLDREQYLESQKDKLELAEAIQEESLHHSELAKTVILNDIKTKPARPEPNLPVTASGLPTKSPDSKLHALMGLHKKRGSYLTRGNQSLVRLAKITSSVPDDENNIVKKKGNFVFSAVDPSPEQVDELKSQTESPKPNSKVQIKRKKSQATPPRLKKLKMHDAGKTSVLSKLMQANDF